MRENHAPTEAGGHHDGVRLVGVPLSTLAAVAALHPWQTGVLDIADYDRTIEPHVGEMFAARLPGVAGMGVGVLVTSHDAGDIEALCRRVVIVDHGRIVYLDDLDPRQKKPQLKNLDAMNIDDLKEYIAALKAEIVRVEDKLKAKQSHASAAASFFKK